MFPKRIIFKDRERKNKAKHNFNPELSDYWGRQLNNMFHRWKDTKESKVEVGERIEFE